MPGIGPKLPLEKDETDGFKLTKTIHETVRQNLKNLFRRVYEILGDWRRRIYW